MGERNELQTVQQPSSTLATMDFGPQMMAEHLAGLRQFIGSQLRDGHDYGKIPGCGDKPSLLKPGAEKMGTLFNLKAQFECTQRVIDYEKPLGLFSYKCRVGKMIDGAFVTFGECEAICSTEETKYKFKTRWQGREKIQTEDPDRMTKINTVMKMAQKRAYVGAMILATGASEYFTQDLEDMDLGGNASEDSGESRPAAKPQAAKPAAAPAQPAAPKPPSAATVAATGAIKVICDVAWPEFSPRMTELEFVQAVTGGKFDTIEQLKAAARADLSGGHGAVQVCEWAKKADEMLKSQPA